MSTMKKIIHTIVFVFGVLSLHAECFTTQIYFEDKDGNKDTLTIGVSENISECEIQTDTWSEEDALSALTSGRHWAWFGYSVANNRPCAPHRIHINPPTTGDIESGKIRMWYPQDRLPVIVSWNKEGFADPSRSKSIFSDMCQWFDVSCGGELHYAFACAIDSLHFTQKQGWDFSLVQLENEVITVNSLGFAFCSEDVWKRMEDEEKYPWIDWMEVDEVQSSPQVQPKLILEHGMLYIINGDKRYSIIGM
jgi:hypothetical protein